MAAGAVHTPHLLQLSGVGDGSALAAQGIAAEVELPGVGQNLQVRRRGMQGAGPCVSLRFGLALPLCRERVGGAA